MMQAIRNCPLRMKRSAVSASQDCDLARDRIIESSFSAGSRQNLTLQELAHDHESREEPSSAEPAPPSPCPGSNEWRLPLPPPRSPNHPSAWSSCTCPTACCPEHWTPTGDGEDYELTPHLKPLEEPQERFPAAGESLERQDRRPQRPLAQSARLALRRLRRTHLRRRSRFRRHLRRSVRRRSASAIAPCCPASNSASKPPAPASIPPAAASPACTGPSSPGATRIRPSPKRSFRSSPSTASSAPTKRPSFRA